MCSTTEAHACMQLNSEQKTYSIHLIIEYHTRNCIYFRHPIPHTQLVVTYVRIYPDINPQNACEIYNYIYCTHKSTQQAHTITIQLVYGMELYEIYMKLYRINIYEIYMIKTNKSCAILKFVWVFRIEDPVLDYRQPHCVTTMCANSVCRN